MNLNTPSTNPFHYPNNTQAREDWEIWDEDLMNLLDSPTETQYGMNHPEPTRLKSRLRQKAQNEHAGIKMGTIISHSPKIFENSVSLKALEGNMKQRPADFRALTFVKKSVTGPEMEISTTPGQIPIVWTGEQGGVPGPEYISSYFVRPSNPESEAPYCAPQQRSMWSPDTEATTSPYSVRPASSIYSQPSMYANITGASQAPPVPALPAALAKLKESQTAATPGPYDDDDVGTPCTEFEEEGSPIVNRKSFRAMAGTVSPESAGSRPADWWNYANPTPTQDRNPFKQQTQQTGQSTSSSISPEEWWHGVDEKKPKVSRDSGLVITTSAILQEQQNTARRSQSLYNKTVPLRLRPLDRHETQSEKARILLEENRAPSDEPPPYSPSQTTKQVNYGALYPTSYVVNTEPIPSPGPISPGLPVTMSSQGGIGMANIPLTPRPAVIPNRPVGSQVPGDHFHSAAGTRHRVERERRRHEKEEVAARKLGGVWRGRGCIPETGCFGRAGREGRKRRRVYLGICGGVLASIILIVVLAVMLIRKPPSTRGPEDTIWLNLTSFPPMPTGVLTLAGPDNSDQVSECLALTTAWSCTIPKDQQDPNALYDPWQPEFVFQIQYDNNTRQLWNVADSGEQPVQPDSGNLQESPLFTRRETARAITEAAEAIRRSIVYDAGFLPNPAPPSIAEMKFLGNTTDAIVSDNKAGEPTPFYMSLLSSINATVGPNMLARRGLGNGIDAAPENGTSDWNLTNILPAPELNPDGTGAPATMYPLPSQQPVRLFDRGLDTEHYGFYTFFNKTIYLSNNTVVANDRDGGALLRDAEYLVTWSQTRFLIQIWTRMENTTQMLGNGTGPGTNDTMVHAKPGTMPYPVTITEDLHGGDRISKTLWWYRVDDDQHINRTDPKLIIADRGFGGKLVNAMDSNANTSLGGIDGGTGGCKCEWKNFEIKRNAQ